MATRLSRSVGRLTSCDALPCLEYGDEVLTEQALARELFYLQHCRKIGPGRVKVTGHLPL